MPWTAFPRPTLIGVVHLLATPGAPRYGGSMDAVLELAQSDARALLENGCDGVIVENFGDAPFFPERVPPETVAALALAVRAITRLAGERPVGVNVLRNDARSALGIAAACGASFVRINVHAGAAITDQGLVEGRAHETLRERARLDPRVGILADVLVKHATTLSTASVGESVRELVERALADGVIVSGAATGRAPALERVREAREAAGNTPILLGSGVDAHNAREFLAHASGAIVGTSLKRDGLVSNPVDPERVKRLRRVFDEARR